jgi:hypothetical protein
VETPAWGIHVFGPSGLVQQGELKAELASVVRLDAGFAPRLEKAFQPFVHERFNHGLIVNR